MFIYFVILWHRQVLRPFLASSDIELKGDAFVILASVINDNETHMLDNGLGQLLVLLIPIMDCVQNGLSEILIALNSASSISTKPFGSDVIRNIIDAARTALQSPDNIATTMSGTSYRASECLNDLARISANDNNKMRVRSIETASSLCPNWPV